MPGAARAVPARGQACHEVPPQGGGAWYRHRRRWTRWPDDRLGLTLNIDLEPVHDGDSLPTLYLMSEADTLLVSAFRFRADIPWAPGCRSVTRYDRHLYALSQSRSRYPLPSNPLLIDHRTPRDSAIALAAFAYALPDSISPPLDRDSSHCSPTRLFLHDLYDLTIS